MRDNPTIAVILGLALVLGLAGCAGPYQDSSSTAVPETVPVSDAGGIEEVSVELSSRLTVTCLKWSQWDYLHEAMKSGLDCNWDGQAKRD